MPSIFIFAIATKRYSIFCQGSLISIFFSMTESLILFTTYPLFTIILPLLRPQSFELFILGLFYSIMADL